MALAHQAIPSYNFYIEIHLFLTFFHTSSVLHIDMPSPGNKIIKDQLTMERYKPRKHKSPIKAIRENCIECMGGRGSGQNYSKLIAGCTSINCPVHEFRFGKNPYLKKRTERQLKTARDNLKRGYENPKPRGIRGMN